jgi:hypothetical protein
MNDNEREMDLALAEAEQENRLLRARNERLERELAVERDACAEAAGIALLGADRALTERVLKAIRARGQG